MSRNIIIMVTIAVFWHFLRIVPTQIKTATLGQLPQAPLPSAFRNTALAWLLHAPSSLAEINVRKSKRAYRSAMREKDYS